MAELPADAAAAAAPRVAGTYYLQPNQKGGGAHVANCGYATLAQARGRGVARTMCLHSLEVARRQGYLAVQFNFVVASNEGAVALWKSLGFEVVGTRAAGVPPSEPWIGRRAGDAPRALTAKVAPPEKQNGRDCSRPSE